MIDLHSHILPGIDDGAPDIATALDMARAYSDQGVEWAVCTPHILPGLYENSGQVIKSAVASLQKKLNEAGIPLRLAAGADNHIVRNFTGLLKSGHLLSIAGGAYVLVEPPHHVAPAFIESFFFEIILAGYVPIVTHPERLTWIESKYEVIRRLSKSGVWMQVTSGSLRGSFGRRPRYWAERMIEEGMVHILATDAHNSDTRPPDLWEGLRAAERLLGSTEAQHLVVTRPRGALLNEQRKKLPAPSALNGFKESRGYEKFTRAVDSRPGGGFGERVRRLLG